MRIAFTIGSYRLFDFVHLNLRQILALAPGSPVLISDDPSPESVYIKRLAEERGACYSGTERRRGHFAADLQSLVNAVAFAKEMEADVAVKISQRFILAHPDAIAAIADHFSDPSILMGLPGPPKRIVGNKAAKGFASFAVLSDFVCLRTCAITPGEILDLYRRRVTTEQVPWKAFIEAAVHAMHLNFGDQSKLMPAFTDHSNPAAPIYLRRYQNSEEQYRALARAHGIYGQFPLTEWGQIEGQQYLSQPVVV